MERVSMPAIQSDADIRLAGTRNVPYPFPVSI